MKVEVYWECFWKEECTSDECLDNQGYSYRRIKDEDEYESGCFD
jgi:hypothetical protein